MKVMEFLSDKAISAELKATDKEGILKEMTQLLVDSNKVDNPKEVLKALMDREALVIRACGAQRVHLPSGLRRIAR